ncbi:MAG: SMC-Scp complex subunit ScpB [Pseudomonadota bacterium]|nr:SMC-Scp complex subunit ScpB [Pseudomonadota bacterium]
MSLDQETVKRIVEGALFAAGQPMKLDKLAGLFLEEEAPPTEMLVEAINQLKEEYAGRGVMLKEVASGFRFQVQESVGEWVSRLWEEKPARYSRALLETLALIAYRQPITRGEIEEIRGVSVSSHITKTLLEREWIRVVGHRDVPGRPAMYGTTRTFLDYFNLKNLDELPSLAEIRDLDTINAELELVQRGLDPNGQLDVDESGAAEDGDSDLTGQSDTEGGGDHSSSEADSQPAESEEQTVAQSALDHPTETEQTGDPKPGELT